MASVGATARCASAFVALSLATVTTGPHRAAAIEPEHLFHHEASRISMACEYAIEAYGPDADALPRIVDEGFDEVDRIDRLMSHYKSDSPLSRVNPSSRRCAITATPAAPSTSPSAR
ncbi:MAG: hypothetical protein DMG03_00105 [Acidobacteria bacterium]|nr:MAG: hypothetical protein DMG03_00105 [Acidobacteriota bacterium]